MGNKNLNNQEQKFELISKEAEIKKEKEYLIKRNTKIFIMMMLLNAIFVLLLMPAISLTVFDTILFTTIIDKLIIVASTIGICGINTFLGLKNINNNKKKINAADEQLDFLNEIKHSLEEEKEKTSNNKLKINTSLDWKRKLRLIKAYNRYKKEFIRHYKKGNLDDLLYHSGYSNSDTYYLYNRAREEIEEKNNQKILKRNKVNQSILDIWNN